jgi:hypothetical protein
VASGDLVFSIDKIIAYSMVFLSYKGFRAYRLYIWANVASGLLNPG